MASVFNGYAADYESSSWDLPTADAQYTDEQSMDTKASQDPLLSLGAYNGSSLSQSLGARLSRHCNEDTTFVKSEEFGTAGDEQLPFDPEAPPFVFDDFDNISDTPSMEGNNHQPWEDERRGSAKSQTSTQSSPTDNQGEDGSGDSTKDHANVMQRRRERNRAAQKAFRERRDKRESRLQVENESLHRQLEQIRTNMGLLRRHRPGLYQHLQISLGNILREARAPQHTDKDLYAQLSNSKP